MHKTNCEFIETIHCVSTISHVSGILPQHHETTHHEAFAFISMTDENIQ